MSVVSASLSLTNEILSAAPGPPDAVAGAESKDGSSVRFTRSVPSGSMIQMSPFPERVEKKTILEPSLSQAGSESWSAWSVRRTGFEPSGSMR